jgi:hypothetical protein
MAVTTISNEVHISPAKTINEKEALISDGLFLIFLKKLKSFFKRFFLVFLYFLKSPS